MRTAALRTAATLSAAALTFGLAAPASAATVHVADPEDTAHGSDLVRVSVHNGERSVLVVTRHVNLRRSPASGSGGAVYLDTDPADRGPEYVFVGGYFEGTDYSLLHTEGFGPRKWGEPVDGAYRMRLDYDAEQVRMRMSRAALGHPDELRVAVRVSGTRSDGTSDGLVDWLGKPRSLTDWVARG